MRALEIQGTTVPKLGFGTWQIEGPECQEAVEDALAIGYRHIDTARAYGNEEHVGRGIAAAGVPRNEFFLTTKIAREEYAPDDLRRAAEDSLREAAGRGPRPAAPALAEPRLPARGDARRARRAARRRADQAPRRLELPGGDAARGAASSRRSSPTRSSSTRSWARTRSSSSRRRRTSWSPPTPRSPAARSREDPTLREIGEAHGKTAGQVALRWLLDKPQVCDDPEGLEPRAPASRTSRSSTSSSAMTSGRRSRRCPRTSASSTPASGRTGTPRRRQQVARA